jgi:hypothetical protein
MPRQRSGVEQRSAWYVVLAHDARLSVDTHLPHGTCENAMTWVHHGHQEATGT